MWTQAPLSESLTAFSDDQNKTVILVLFIFYSCWILVLETIDNLLSWVMVFDMQNANFLEGKNTPEAITPACCGVCTCSLDNLDGEFPSSLEKRGMAHLELPCFVYFSSFLRTFLQSRVYSAYWGGAS